MDVSLLALRSIFSQGRIATSSVGKQKVKTGKAE
jgi:hypothetical protein